MTRSAVCWPSGRIGMASERLLRQHPPPSYVVALGASGLLALALAPSFGAFSPLALSFVLAGLLVLAALFVEQLRVHSPGVTAVLRTATTASSSSVLLPTVIWALLFAMGFAAWTDPYVVINPVVEWRVGRLAQLAMLLVLATYLPALVAPRLQEPQLLRHVRFALLAALVLLGGWDVLRASPVPAIDVWALQQAGAADLLQGRNPYTEVSVADTGPVGDVVPYLYWPGQLLVTLPAYALGGDVRYAMLVAVVVAGVCLRTLARRTDQLPALLQDAPALFVWLAPKLFYVLQSAWTEPIPLALLCAAVTARAYGRPWLTAAFVGAAVSSKQTIAVLAPVLLLGLRCSMRHLVLAATLPFAVLLVFAVWDPAALFEATVSFVAQLPAREDSLTLLNWWYLRYGTLPPDAIGLVVIAAVTAAVVRAVRTQASLSLATTGAALAATALFALGQLAFANYYFLASGLCALAAAASLPRTGE